MPNYTTDNLVEAVLRKITAPQADQLNTTPERVVQFLDDELKNTLSPLILSVKEDYFTAHKDVNVTSENTLPNGYYAIPIPSDAMYESVRYVCWVTNNGLSTPMARIALENAQGSSATTFNWFNYNFVNGFYLENNNIIIAPNTWAVGGTVRIYYFKRPGELILTQDAALVSSVNTLTNEVIVNQIPVNWTTDDTLDCINQRQPFNVKASELSILNLSSPTIELSDVSQISKGNWLCLSGYSTIPEIPVEGMGLLTQSAAVMLLSALTDNESIKEAQNIMRKYRDDFINVLTPRTQGNPKKINSLGAGFYASPFTNNWFGGSGT